MNSDKDHRSLLKTKTIWIYLEIIFTFKCQIWRKTCGCAWYFIKFIYSEKDTKFCEIFPLHLTVCTVVKSKGKISQNFVAFSEYMKFKEENCDWVYFHTTTAHFDSMRKLCPRGYAALKIRIRTVRFVEIIIFLPNHKVHFEIQ